MRLLILLSMIFSSCAHRSRSLPARPDANLCVYNHQLGAKKCFNMKRDYDSNGNLLHSAVPYYEKVTELKDFDKNITVDPHPDWGNFKAWINELKFKIQN